MKKVLLVLLLCGISAVCFAKGNLELFAGMPLAWDSESSVGVDASVQTTSASIGFAGISPTKNEKISFGVYGEVILPQKMEGEVNGVQTTLKRDDFDTLMGMSMLFGPVFNLYSSENGKVKIPLIVGVRWMWMVISTEYANTFGSQFGLGAGIGAEFHPSEKVYFFGRVTGVYDFLTFGFT